MSTVRLVTRADDAGMHAVANHAIADTITHGIVRNVSLMAPAPAIRNAYQELASLDAEVDFGLHLTLTCEWTNLRWKPVHEQSGATLTRDDGTMHYSVAELQEANPDSQAILAEVEAQYELLVNLGFKLTYLDEHMGVGSIPGLAERLSRFASDRSLIYDRALKASGRLAPFPAWDGPGEHPGTELADQLSTMADGTYLLVGHPLNKDEALLSVQTRNQAPGEMVQQRNRQRRMFMDIEIVDYCEKVGIELYRYSRV
jgi:chitin disaccharide deacetylase